MTFSVAGKGVVVTGAAGGIGRAISARLAEAGARLVLSDLDSERLHAVSSELGAHPVAGDAASAQGVASLIDEATAVLGRVDMYVANAGVATALGLEADDQVWQGNWELHVMAHVRAARLLVPRWVEQGGGCFVATASAAGLLMMVGDAPYTVTKHGTVAFAEWLSVTYGDRGVTVHAICPQGVRTPLYEAGESLKPVLDMQTILEPDAVADALMTSLDDGSFLVLPHPEVRDYYSFRAARTDRWLTAMRDLRQVIDPL